MSKSTLLVWLLIVFLAACGGSDDSTGPKLIQEVTLPPTEITPTRYLSPTPEPVVAAQSTSELISPLDVVTLDADFVLVTPTLPPSKTPTQTPTITPTSTQTPTPTVTVTATATAPLFPTSMILPVTAIVANPLMEVCDSQWFFIQPRPANCPLNPPLVSNGVFQEFQNGYMVWVGHLDAIYIMYNDMVMPRWQVVPDTFDEGMQEDDPAYNDSPYPNTWQPRRGFGMLWRRDAVIRARIGWATERWERPFSVQTQTAPDGTIFISEPGGGVFGLTPGGSTWALYSGYEGF